jgi:hypothetical protein
MGCSLLIIASRMGCVDLAEILIQKGIDIEHADNVKNGYFILCFQDLLTSYGFV